MKTKDSIGFREKLRARIRREVPVSKEQKLARKIESLTKEAEALHADGVELRGKAETFSTRASTTHPPSPPPPNRDPLFRPQGETAPPSQYETELKAYELLLDDWKGYKQDVKEFSKRIDRFATSLEATKKKNGSKPGRAFTQTDHEFEGLKNALQNLREQKMQIDRDVEKVPLPANKTKM